MKDGFRAGFSRGAGMLLVLVAVATSLAGCHLGYQYIYNGQNFTMAQVQIDYHRKALDRIRQERAARRRLGWSEGRVARWACDDLFVRLIQEAPPEVASNFVPAAMASNFVPAASLLAMDHRAVCREADTVAKAESLTVACRDAVLDVTWFKYVAGFEVTANHEGKPVAGCDIRFDVPGSPSLTMTRTTGRTGKVEFPLPLKHLAGLSRSQVEGARLVRDGKSMRLALADSEAYAVARRKAAESEAIASSGLPPCANHDARMCPGWWEVGRCHDGTRVVEQGCFDPSKTPSGSQDATNVAAATTDLVAVTVATQTVCGGRARRPAVPESDVLVWTFEPTQKTIKARLQSWDRVPAKQGLTLTGRTTVGDEGSAKLLAQTSSVVAGYTLVATYMLDAKVESGAFRGGVLRTVMRRGDVPPGRPKCLLVGRIKVR